MNRDKLINAIAGSMIGFAIYGVIRFIADLVKLFMVL